MGQYQPLSLSPGERPLTARSGRSRIVWILIRWPHQVDAATFSRLLQMPCVQLGYDLLHRPRHGLEFPLAVAANSAGAVKRNHLAMPVGAFRAGRRIYSPDRYDLVGLFNR